MLDHSSTYMNAPTQGFLQAIINKNMCICHFVVLITNMTYLLCSEKSEHDRTQYAASVCIYTVTDIKPFS